MRARTGSSSSARPTAISVPAASGTSFWLGRPTTIGAAPLQRQAHHHLGAAIKPAGDAEAAGERGDQREAESEAGPIGIGLWADPGATVADGHGQALAVGLGLDHQRAGSVGIGVDDDVHAGLGDHRLQIGEPGLVHADLLGQPGQSVANHRDVLRPCGKPHLKPGGLLVGGGAVCH